MKTDHLFRCWAGLCAVGFRHCHMGYVGQRSPWRGQCGGYDVDGESTRSFGVSVNFLSLEIRGAVSTTRIKDCYLV